jgi:hypothetical protein
VQRDGPKLYAIASKFGTLAGMAFLLATLAGLAYGGADQYLGSLRPMVLLGSWTPTVSQMSAPWLLLPFMLGATQIHVRRAMVLGFVTTQAALLGYFAMTLSPIEGVAPASVPAGAVALLSENAVYVVGGLVTGPLYGLLGQRWRVRRWWVSAVLVAGALCLEPGARAAAGRLFPPSVVWAAEVALGALIAVYFVQRLLSHRRVSLA